MIALGPQVRHPKFQWTGVNRSGEAVQLALHAQYTANDTIHARIVRAIQDLLGSQFDVCLFHKDWHDEAVQGETALFVKRMLRKWVRPAAKLDEDGDLAVWIEIEATTETNDEAQTESQDTGKTTDDAGAARCASGE